MQERENLSEIFIRKKKYMKPECEKCNIGGHGFICYSKDGSCLKTRYNKKDNRSDRDINTGSGK